MKHPPAIALDTVIQRSRSFLAADLDNDTILLGLQKSQYYGMRATANDIWQLLAEPRSIARICDFLQDKYDVARGQCEQDVLAFLLELLDVGLVCIRESDSETSS